MEVCNFNLSKSKSFGMKSLFKFCILSATVVSVFIKSQIVIKGTISDTRQAVEFVTVKASNKDGNISTISDKNGSFRLNLKTSGSYRFELNKLGYEKLEQEVDIEDSKALSFTLKEKILDRNIQGVNIIYPEIKRKPNGYEYNVDKSFLSKGNDVNDILPLLPGVFTTHDGSISLNGEGVLLMVDNREIKMPSAQLKLYLKTIRSENIKNIEVITSPTAAYDAEGVSGVIKINTKSKSADGILGSITEKFMQGRTPKNTLSGNLLYGRGRLMAYTSASLSNNVGSMSLSDERYNADYRTRQSIESNTKGKALSYTLGAGLKYAASKSSSLAFDASVGSSHSEPIGHNNYTLYNIYKADLLTTSVESPSSYKNESNTLSLSSNYQNNTDKAGSSLKITADYLHTLGDNSSFTPNNYFDGSHNFIKNVTNKDRSNKLFDIFSFKIDRHRAFNKNSTLDYGIKFASADTSVDYIYSVLQDQTWKIDDNVSINLDYREKIYAGYSSYETKINKVGIIGGLRAEYTNYTISGKKNDYLKFFPNVSLNFPLSSKDSSKNLSINYNRRINRPSYEILNPFKVRVDEFATKYGNPYLKPTISDKVSATISFKNNYSISASYRHQKDVFGEVQKSSGSNMVIQTFDNVNSTDEFALTGNATVAIKPSWMMVSAANLINTRYSVLGEDYSVVRATLSNINIIRPSKNTEFRITTQFMSKGRDRFMTINKNMILSSIDFSQYLDKHKAFQLKAGVNDIFNSYGGMSVTFNYGSQTNFTKIKRDSRYAYIGLTYSFKKGTDVKKSEYEKSNVEEEQRTK